jgi:hypothetical protein
MPLFEEDLTRRHLTLGRPDEMAHRGAFQAALPRLGVVG